LPSEFKEGAVKRGRDHTQRRKTRTKDLGSHRPETRHPRLRTLKRKKSRSGLRGTRVWKFTSSGLFPRSIGSPTVVVVAYKEASGGHAVFLRPDLRGRRTGPGAAKGSRRGGKIFPYPWLGENSDRIRTMGGIQRGGKVCEIKRNRELAFWKE